MLQDIQLFSLTPGHTCFPDRGCQNVGKSYLVTRLNGACLSITPSNPAHTGHVHAVGFRNSHQAAGVLGQIGFIRKASPGHELPLELHSVSGTISIGAAQSKGVGPGSRKVRAVNACAVKYIVGLGLESTFLLSTLRNVAIHCPAYSQYSGELAQLAAQGLQLPKQSIRVIRIGRCAASTACTTGTCSCRAATPGGRATTGASPGWLTKLSLKHLLLGFQLFEFLLVNLISVTLHGLLNTLGSLLHALGSLFGLAG